MGEQPAPTPVYQICAPNSFSFHAEDWNAWIRRFERFRVASGLSEKTPEEQVNSLVYLMGPQAEEIYASFDLTEAQQRVYETVKTRFQNFFVPTRNVIYERFKFNTRSQEEGESVEDFVTSLHALARHCDYPVDFKEQMIRDRIVCGLRDKRVSERLQLEQDLTLERAVTSARQAETIKKQQPFLEQGKPITANNVAYRKDPKRKPARNPSSKGKDSPCKWCGKATAHKKTECPAVNAKCHLCKKIGHYANVCRSKTEINTVNEEDTDSSTGYLGHIHDNVSGVSKWTAQITVNGFVVPFRVDTGADVSVISKELFSKVWSGQSLQSAKRQLFGPGQQKLDILGSIAATLQHKKNKVVEPLYVVRNLQMPLLGWRASERLDLVTRLGQVSSSFFISSDGIRPDPKKTEAIADFPCPNNVTDLKRFLGMVNFFGKFIPNMAVKANPLYELLRSDVEWTWSGVQENAFSNLKAELCKTPVLALYNRLEDVYISTDASSYGLGAMLYQVQADQKRPIAYASRTLSTAERGYAQIEKEALGIVWGCDKFHDYIVGLTVHIETDHKPLVPILMSKPLDSLSPRLQRLRLRLLRYSYEVSYTAGKDLIVADALSRGPRQEDGEKELSEELAAYIQMVISDIPAGDKRLTEIWMAQQDDMTCADLYKYAANGWPLKHHLPTHITRYWEFRDSITVQDGLLMKDARLVIPESMRREILTRLHDGHQGITKCRARAQESVWWPGISCQIEEMINSCDVCSKYQVYHREPLIKSEFPERPWQKVGVDLFKLKNKWYVIVADYYSRFMEIALLEDQRAATVINHMKSIFSRYGIPEIIRSDCGSQFSTSVELTREYKIFSKQYGFEVVTSSPRYPQSNGFIESMVKNCKLHLMKSEEEDPYLVMLALRSTPMQNGYSPAELLMGRKLRTPLPMISRRLEPKLPDDEILRSKEARNAERQRDNYNSQHGARNLEKLHPGDAVWVSDLRTHGTVQENSPAPRSYVVNTPRGQIRRNRIHLHRSTNPASSERITPPEGTDELYRTRSGRIVKPPEKLNL